MVMSWVALALMLVQTVALVLLVAWLRPRRERATRVQSFTVQDFDGGFQPDKFSSSTIGGVIPKGGVIHLTPEQETDAVKRSQL